MKSVKYESSLFLGNSRTAVVHFQRDGADLRRYQHLHLATVPGKLARVIDQHAHEAINGFRRCPHGGDAIAQLRETETLLHGLSHDLESFGARGSDRPDVGDLFSSKFFLFAIGASEPQQILNDLL